jgi:hypothetical protein
MSHDRDLKGNVSRVAEHSRELCSRARARVASAKEAIARSEQRRTISEKSWLWTSAVVRNYGNDDV